MTDLESIVSRAAHEEVKPLLREAVSLLEQKMRDVLHLNISRTPFLTQEEAWDILMTYPCYDMPFLTKEYILALLQAQGIVHPMDLDRFLHQWRKEGRLTMYGTHVIFEPLETQGVSFDPDCTIIQSDSDNTTITQEVFITPDKVEPLALENRILRRLREQDTPYTTSKELRLLLEPTMTADQFLSVLKRMEGQGLVALEHHKGLPTSIRLTTHQIGDL